MSAHPPEAVLRTALREGAAAMVESSDLLQRVQISIEEDRRLRTQRRRRVAIVACFVGAVAAVVAATAELNQGELIMDWWILELIWFVVMVGLAVWLGPFIRRFGRSYAADVFRANPRTGKSFVTLMDVAYYLIFFAYILFTVQFEPADGWDDVVGAAQLRATAVRVGGILLIVGLLHGLNVLTLPFIGRMLAMNRQLDHQVERVTAASGNGADDASRVVE